MNKISELRRSTNMSQQRFADFFHIPSNTIRQWEAGRRQPPDYIPYMMEKILKYEYTEKPNTSNRKEAMHMTVVEFNAWKEKHPKRYAIAEITSFPDTGVILYTSNRPLKTKFDLEFSDNPKYKYIEP